MNVKRFGIDAPLLPLVYLVGGVWLLIYGYLNRMNYSVVVEMVLGAMMVIGAGIALHTTMRGKYRLFDQLIQQLAIDPHAQVLDVGCGRGALLTRVAQQLVKPGKVTGIDLWRSRDQSNNGVKQAQRNLDDLNVADRTELVTGDMAELPFDDNQFDVVTTSFAFHNIKRFKRRNQAVEEAIRVLKPGGTIAIIDTGHCSMQYQDVFLANHVQITESKKLGINGWWSGPWMGSYLVRGVKQ